MLVTDAPDRKPIVSYLGPVGSYSHQAVRQVFPEANWELQPAVTIDDIFDQVQDGQVTTGVVPFENSTNGSVVFTLDNLADRSGRYADIIINGEIYVDVHHCLLGHRSPPGAASVLDEAVDGSGTCTPAASEAKSKPLHSIKHVKRLYSHPQAFGQCNAFISTYLKGVEVVDVSSTSKAAEVVSQDATGTWAAIASPLAADICGLDVLGESIEDRDDNTTRFLIICKRSTRPSEGSRMVKQAMAQSGSKSLVSFTVPHTAPGALADVLSCFKACDLNLTSINSRPSLVGPFQYMFFVEFEGHRYDDDGRVEDALERIGIIAENWRWLGSWERYR